MLERDESRGPEFRHQYVPYFAGRRVSRRSPAMVAADLWIEGDGLAGSDGRMVGDEGTLLQRQVRGRRAKRDGRRVSFRLPLPSGQGSLPSGFTGARAVILPVVHMD